MLTASSLSSSLSLTQNSRSVSVRFLMTNFCMVMLPFGGMMIVPTASFFSNSFSVKVGSSFSVFDGVVALGSLTT